MILPWSDARDELLKRIAKRSIEWGLRRDEDGSIAPATVDVTRWRIRRGSATVASVDPKSPDDWMIATDTAFAGLPAADYVVELGRAREITGSSTFDIASITVSWDPQGSSPQLFLTAQYREMAQVAAAGRAEAETNLAAVMKEQRDLMKAVTDCQVKMAESMPAVMISMRQVNEEVGECVVGAAKLYMAAHQEAAAVKVQQAQNSIWTIILDALKDNIIEETRQTLPSIRGLFGVAFDLGKMVTRKFLPGGST